MIEVVSGPLVVEPVTWFLVFNREASTWWASALAMGRHKHVRAFAYVPFLHVWAFVDVTLSGTSIVLAADGEPAYALSAAWMTNADVVRIRRRARARRSLPVAGWCVPAMRRLIGIPGGALRPSAFLEECLRHGGEPFEAFHGHPAVPATAG